ncbi:MAG: hypothetical protein R3349_09585, partial [Geminicoccaceae bacterium]|nr:hypothetical protein [Geminicoccaceae bacterium]
MRMLGQVSAVSLLVALGLAAGQVQAQAVCDTDDNGQISVSEAEDCADRDYTTLLGDKESMTDEDFATVHDAEAFSKVDADGDGMVSRAEYVGWKRDEFDGALGASVEMPNADFEALHNGGVMKSQGADSQT